MAAPNRLRFFPTPSLAAPSTNGNGKHAAPPSEQKALLWTGASFYPDGLGGIVPAESVQGLAWYRASWLAYACMRYRATKLVEAPLWVAEEKDGEEQWLEGDHPLAELLERPNPDMEMADLLEWTSLFLDSTGACLWVKNRGRAGRVESLYPFSADDFSTFTAGGRVHGRFQVRTASGARDYAPEDVILFGNPDPADPHRFVGPLHAALARLGIDTTLVESIRSGLRNAVVPGMTLVFPDHITKDQVDEFRAGISATYQESRNHGKTFIAGGGLTATRNKLGFEGLHGGDLGKEIEAAVCACFQLPPVVIGAFVGLANSSDRHNLETSVLLVYDNAIIPTWTRMERALTRGLLRPVDDNPLRFVRFDKSQIKALQDDRGAQAEIIAQVSGALTINDARAMLDLPPLEDERGERLMSEPVFPALPMPAPDAEPKEEPDAEEAEKSRRAALERKAIDEDELQWIVFDQVARAQELGWQMAAAEQLAADRAVVLALAARHLRTRQKDDDPLAPADPDTVRELIREIAAHLDLEAALQWRARVAALTEATARRAVERAAAQLGLSFDLLQPGLLEYVEKEAAWLVTQVTDTTKQAVRDALAAGLAEGEGIPALSKRIEESAAFSRERATLIARTETTRVTNGGQRESLATYQAESGDRIVKRWLTARDAWVRDAHVALEGEERPVEAAFSNGLQAPGEPNCRCALIYRMEATSETGKAAAALVEATKVLAEVAAQPPAPITIQMAEPRAGERTITFARDDAGGLKETVEEVRRVTRKTVQFQKNDLGEILGADITTEE